ncbi:MAG: HAMP domain-containing histidine kinase [Candidatus Ancillula sp.]|jgi:signal transduction histidine kinase|nr:HAMP domain-containing histidine kinase [Candidatus Ancillula sp.]
MFNNANKKAKIDELQRRVDELEEQLLTTKLQSHELISNVSHEIRTPLAAIMAIMDNLVDGVTKWSDATGKQILDYCERQNNLITFLLDLSKLESGSVELKKEEVNISSWLLSVVEPLECLEAHKRLTYALNVNPKELVAVFDPARLGQVLTNLLTNAINHADDCSEIEVAAMTEDDRIVFLVHNSGKALDTQEFEIFKRFNTDAVNSKGRTGGTGLGLSIAKWIVDLHGGTIEVVDPALHGYASGALFKVTI